MEAVSYLWNNVIWLETVAQTGMHCHDELTFRSIPTFSAIYDALHKQTSQPLHTGLNSTYIYLSLRKPPRCVTL